MVGHPRRAAFAAVFAAALALPLLAPPGIALAHRGGSPADVEQVNPGTDPQDGWGQTFALWGAATGSSGSIDGATVRACPAATPFGGGSKHGGGCRSGTVGGGSWMIQGLQPGAYTIQVSAGGGYGSGFLAVGAPGNFSRAPGAATSESVGPSHQVAGMVVPAQAPVPPPQMSGSISGQVLVFYPRWFWPGPVVTTNTGVPVVGGTDWPVGGGTVTACPVAARDPWPWGTTDGAGANGSWMPGPDWGCVSANIGMDGRFRIAGLRSGAYTVGIRTGFGPVPPGATPNPVDPQQRRPDWWYPIGWFSANSVGNFTTSLANATPVWVRGPVWLPPIVVNQGWNPPVPTVPTSAAVFGNVVGLSASALAGGVVSACNTSTWICSSTSIQASGTWSFASLPNATYRIAIAPPTGSVYPSGFYASGRVGNFSVTSADATYISVAGVAINVPTITVPAVVTVPPNVGGINTGPRVVVVVSYARPRDSLATTSVVRVRKGQPTEVIACVGRDLAGTTVEVWRRLPGRSWAFLTTRSVSASGCSRYIFTPTMTASYRFRVPGSTMAIAVWGPARTVVIVR